MLWWKSLFTKNLVPLSFSACWGERLGEEDGLELFVYFVVCFLRFVKQLRNLVTSLVHFCILYVYMKINVTRSLKLATHLLFHSTPLQRERDQKMKSKKIQEWRWFIGWRNKKEENLKENKGCGAKATTHHHPQTDCLPDTLWAMAIFFKKTLLQF